MSLGFREAAALEVSGIVVDEAGAPLQGASVRFQARPAQTLTDATGAFRLEDPDLSFDPGASALVTAALAGRLIAFEIVTADGQSDLRLELALLPPDDPDFSFEVGRPEFCRTCHADGEEVTIYGEFRSSRHFNAGRNAWVAAALADFRTRHAGESGFCADCHAPGAFVGTRKPGSIDLADPDTVDLLALDPNAASSPRRNGVQCLTCHRVRSVSQDVKAINLAGGAELLRSANPQDVFGPLDDVAAMNPSPAPFFRDSLYCAACHEYDRPAEGARPAVPGQATYSEWLRWQARLPAGSPLKDTATCQHCHMPPKSETEPVRACSTGPLRDPAFQPVRTHGFAGTTLGPAQTLPDGSSSMLDGAGTLSLQAVQIAPDELEVSVQLANTRAGHKLPTGIDIRDLLVLVEARDAAGRPLAAAEQRSSLLPWWAGQGSGPEDYAGFPGKAYAKILSRSRQDFADPAAQRVEFAEAECEVLDNRIEGGHADAFGVVFRLPEGTPGPVKVVARALYRRAWAGFREFLASRGLPPTDALGNPLSDFEIDRARLAFEPAGAAFETPGGTVDLDFEPPGGDAGQPVVIDTLYADRGLRLASVPSARPGCAAVDGHAYAVPDGAGRFALAPAAGAAAHNECTAGVLRLEFPAPAGHVLLEVEADRPGAGFELRALDAAGREVASVRVYDTPADCQLHPVLRPFPLHLDHHGIAALEARGLVEAPADAQVLWTVRRLEYRFDSVHPVVTGPAATPTATATPDPGAPTPTATSTPGPSAPVLDGPVAAGAGSVSVSGVLPPGSRVEVRTLDAGGRPVVLGAGTSDEDGRAAVRLLRPLEPGESVHAVNLRTRTSGPGSVAVAATLGSRGLGASLLLAVLALFCYACRRQDRRVPRDPGDDAPAR